MSSKSFHYSYSSSSGSHRTASHAHSHPTEIKNETGSKNLISRIEFLRFQCCFKSVCSASPIWHPGSLHRRHPRNSGAVARCWSFQRRRRKTAPAAEENVDQNAKTATPKVTSSFIMHHHHPSLFYVPHCRRVEAP